MELKEIYEMPEKIKILELDIDVDALTKRTSGLKSQLDSAKESLSALKKAGDTSSEAFVQQQAKVNNLNAEYRTSQREISKLTAIQNTENLSIKEAQNLLSVVKSQWEKQAALYGENSKEVQALAKKKKELSEKLLEEEKKTGDATRGVGQYSKGVQEALGKSTLFGGTISTVTGFLNGFSPVLKLVKTEVSAAALQMWNAAAGTEGLSKAQKAAVITTNLVSGALKLFKVALISTGIGAIIVLFGSLVAYLSTTQKGIDAVSSVLTPLKVVFESLFGVLQKVGETLAELFTADGIKEFGNAIKEFILSRIELMKDGFGAIGKILTGDIKGGLSDIKGIAVQVKDEVVGAVDAMKGAAGELSAVMQEAYARGKRIADLQVQIEEAETDIVVARAESNKQLKEQEVIAKDISKSASERQAAINEQLSISKEIIASENAILDLQIEQLKLKQQSNDTSREEQKELQELIAKRIKNQELLDDVVRKNLGAQNQLRKEQQALVQKALDDEIKASKAKLDLYIAQSESKANTLKEGLVIAEKVRDEELKILEKQLKAGKKTQDEYNLEAYKIKQDFLNAQTELAIDNASREVQAYIDANKSKIDSDKFFTEEARAQEEARLQGILDEQIKFEQTRFENGLQSQTDLNDAINALNAENDAALQELKIARETAEAERLLGNIALQNEIDAEKRQTDLDLQLEYLEQQRLQEIAAAEQTGVDKDLINKKYSDASKKLIKDEADYQEKIEKEKFKAKLSQAEAVFNGIGELLGKESAAGKAAAIAASVINTFQGVTKALSQGGVLGIATGALVAATGAASIAKIVSTKPPERPKAEKGMFVKPGMLNGKSHSQGGIPIEAEGGEYIVSKKKTSKYRQLLDLINFGDDRPLANTSGYFANGGAVERSIMKGTAKGTIIQQAPLDADALAAKLGVTLQSAIENLPPQFVAVTDINNGQGKYADIVDGANF